MHAFLAKVFAPTFPGDGYVHYHIDDDGNRRFCDESACRPTHDALSGSLWLRAPFR